MGQVTQPQPGLTSVPPPATAPPATTLMLCVAVAAVTAALYAASIAFGLVSFVQWDNLEAFLPGIWYGHSTLLNGSFPLWNPHQNLGEPLHAFGYAGLLYPVYTVIVAAVRSIGGSPLLVLQVSAVMHAAAAAAAMCWLARDCGARAPAAAAAAFTLAGAGYAAVAGTVWVHVWPNLFWQLAGMSAALALLRRGPTMGRLLLAASAQAAPFLTGHVQTAAIAVLAVWVWGAFVLLFEPAARRYAPGFAIAAFSGLLLASPAIIPTLATLASSARVSLLTFGDQQVTAEALLGLFAGPVSFPAGFMDVPTALPLFIGAWIPVALFASAINATRARRTVRNQAAGKAPGLERAAIVAAALMCVLSLGDPGVVYLLLRQLPFWSDTQGPFKFIAAAIPFLVLGGTLSLDRLLVQRASAALRAGALLTVAIACAALVLAPPDGQLATAIVLACIAQALLAAPAGRFTQLSVPASAALLLPTVLAAARSGDHPKAYRDEGSAPFTSEQLRFLEQSRVLPLSSATATAPRVRALATFNTPMLDGYSSATGQRFALSAQRLDRVLPARFDGVPSAEAARHALASDWPIAAGVGLLIVRFDDGATHQLVADTRPDAQVLFRTPYAVAYGIEHSNAPVLIVPAERAGDALPARGSLAAASSAQSNVELIRAELPEVRFRVQSSTPAVAVVSTLLSGELVVRVDGMRVQPRSVFGGLLGVDVGIGLHDVEVRVRRWPLLSGIGAGVIGLLMLLLFARWSSLRRTQ